MIHRATLAVVAALLAGSAEAQTRLPPADPPVTASAPAPGPAGLSNRDRVKGERQTCRAQALAQGLRDGAVRTAVQDCMAKVDPIAAKRMLCAQAAKARNLSGDARRTSVRACVAGG